MLYIYIYIYIYTCIYQNERAGCDTMSIFKRSFTGLNLEVSEHSLPYYLPITGGKIAGLILSPIVLANSLVPNFNSGQCVHYLRRRPLHHGRLLTDIYYKIKRKRIQFCHSIIIFFSHIKWPYSDERNTVILYIYIYIYKTVFRPYIYIYIYANVKSLQEKVLDALLICEFSVCECHVYFYFNTRFYISI